MQRRYAIATFVFALTAFVAAGAGLLLVLAPDRTPAQAARVLGTATAAAEVSDTPPAGGRTEPVSAALSLVPGVDQIARPDQPSRIAIPSIALDANVVEVGITVENGKPVWETAAFAVGYHRGTALPGTRGNTVMAGHISSPVSKKGEVFKRLPEVRVGDRVDVFTGDRKATYEVAEVRVVPPTAVQVMNPTPDATLTLITCYPDRVYSNRLVVVGKLVGQPS